MTAGTTSSPDIVERRVRVRGTDIRLLDAGEGDPLILLHGFGDSAETWARVHGALARSHRVIAPDLPGFGDSGPVAGGPLLDRLVAAVRGLVTVLGIDTPVAVAGNSMGGAVALRFALDDPEAVSRLILVDSAGLAVGIPLWWRLLSLQLIPIGALIRAASGRVPAGVIQGFARRIYPRLVFHDPTVCDDEMRAAFARHYRTRADIDRVTALGKRLVRDLADNSLLRDSVRLTTPLLIVWGRNDRLVPLGDGQRLHRAASRSRLEIIDGCGHCPQLECPQVFLALVDDFLRGSSRSWSAAPAVEQFPA